MENNTTYIHKLQLTSIDGAEPTGELELQHEKIFPRRNPKRLKFQLSEIQTTILNPGLTQLAAIRVKGLQQIGNQTSGWSYPIVSSMVNMATNDYD